MQVYGFIKQENQKKSMKSKPLLLAIICTIFTSIGVTFFKLAAERTFSVTTFLVNGYLWLGLMSYGIGFLLLMKALKQKELSTVYPIIALSYVWVALIAIVWFNEHLSFLRWFGIFLILGGVSAIGWGEKK